MKEHIADAKWNKKTTSSARQHYRYGFTVLELKILVKNKSWSTLISTSHILSMFC